MSAPTSDPSTSPPSNSDKGLSVSAKVGIGAGVGAAALLGVVGADLLLLRRCRKESKHTELVSPYTAAYSPHHNEKYASYSECNVTSELEAPHV